MSFYKRKKTCPFTGPGAQTIDWKDTKTLSRFVSEKGKITPRRVSYVSHKKQRELATAIKRARFMGLMPYVNMELDSGRRPAPRSNDRSER